MEKKSTQLADIISLQKPIVDGAIVRWLRGNREADPKLIEEASVQLEHYKDVDNMAKFFAGATKIQLSDNRLIEGLTDLLTALEALLKDPKTSSYQILKICRDSLQFLVEIDGYFKDNYELPIEPTIRVVRQVLAETIKRNFDKRMLAELYAYIEAYLNRWSD